MLGSGTQDSGHSAAAAALPDTYRAVRKAEGPSEEILSSSNEIPKAGARATELARQRIVPLTGSEDPNRGREWVRSAASFGFPRAHHLPHRV